MKHAKNKFASTTWQGQCALWTKIESCKTVQILEEEESANLQKGFQCI